jgi:dienelactone hydrolase
VLGAHEHLLRDLDEAVGFDRRPLSPLPHHAELRISRFEFTSRGDRVPGRLLLPEAGDGPFPLVLLQHGLNGAKDADYLEGTGGPWARGGAAVASIDFPLHGERANPKLVELLRLGITQPRRADEATRILVQEFFRQSVADLGRALDALEALPEIDAKHIAYASFSLGSIVGATFCADDPRPCAAAFAIGGGGIGPAELDPAHSIERFAPRPSLFVNSKLDEVIPLAAAEALFEAAGEPKERHWFEGGHSEIPGKSLKAMWHFLKRHLEID